MGLKEVATIRIDLTMKNGSNIPALTGLKGDAPAISFKPLLSAAAFHKCSFGGQEKRKIFAGKIHLIIN